MKRIIITGATGFIGKAISKYLKDVEITVMDRKYGGDICKDELFDSFDGSYDALIHLAGKTNVVESFTSPITFYEVNTYGTLNVLNFCKQKNIPLIIYANSYPYGHPNVLPIDETHPIQPHSPYQKSKQFAENILLDDPTVTTVSCRLFNIYGLDQPSHFLMPQIIEQILSNRSLIEVNDLMPKEITSILRTL